MKQDKAIHSSALEAPLGITSVLVGGNASSAERITSSLSMVSFAAAPTQTTLTQ